MKLIILLITSNFGYSQNYYSDYLDQTSEWRIIEHHGKAGFHDITFRTIFFEGLENLNGYTYYKMYQTYYTIGYEFGYSSVISPQSNNTTQFVGFFREDPNGRFYLFNNGTMPFIFNNQLFSNGIETVFFDNQTVLDTQIGDLYFQFCSVDTIDLLTISATNYKKITSLFGGVTTAGQALEGVGNIFTSCSTPQGIDSSLATFNRIHCYTKQGQTYSFYDNYQLPSFLLVDCNTFPIANRQGLTTLTYENSSLMVFPNPAKSILYIQSKNEMELQSVAVYNVLGQLVLTALNPTHTIDVSNLKSGNYFLKVTTGMGSRSVKFIKE